MLRRRPSLLGYFTLKTLGFGFLSVKGWFWPPGVLIYREDLVRTRVATTKKATGIRRSLFYSMVGRQGFGPAARATASALSRLARCSDKRSRVSSAPRPFGFEPVHRQQKSDQPESIAFFSMVGRQGFSLLRRRPLRRFAPCALRWQTLTRFLSSAPFRVRTRAPITKKRPTGVDRFLFYGGPSGVRTLDLGIKSPLLCQLS